MSRLIESRAFDTQLIASCRVGCFKFPDFILAWSWLILLCQLALMWSLNGLFIHLSIGWHNWSASSWNYCEVWIALLVGHVDAHFCLMWRIAVNNQQLFVGLFPNTCTSQWWYSSCVIQPLVEALTLTLDGIVNQLLTRYPSDPPRSLKTITAGSFTPDAVAASATVKPFFSARVILIRMVFSPFLLAFNTLYRSCHSLTRFRSMQNSAAVLCKLAWFFLCHSRVSDQLSDD